MQIRLLKVIRLGGNGPVSGWRFLASLIAEVYGRIVCDGNAVAEPDSIK
jgi:hypothetical protein